MKRGKKLLQLLLAMILVLNVMALPVAAADSDDAVNITDAALKAEINKQLGGDRPADADITEAEMETLTSLSIQSESGVTDLEGIQYAVNLKTLRVEGNVENLGRISGLAALGTLSIQNNDNLTDISVLGSKPALRTLRISYCPNLTTLNGLTDQNYPNLTDLDCSRCYGLSDISALGNHELKNLEVLNFESVESLSDITPLKGYTSLKELNLEKVKITPETRTGYKETVSSLVNLTELDMPYCGLTDEDSDMFSTLKDLDVLILNVNNFTKTDFCEQLPADISVLSLYSNQIKSMDNLAALTQLEILGMGDNQVTDFTFIKSLPSLTGRYVRHVEGTTSFPMEETSTYGDVSNPVEVTDNIYVIENPYVDPDGDPISFEGAYVTYGDDSVEVSYDAGTNRITLSNISGRSHVIVATDYILPLADGEEKVCELRVEVYADQKESYTISYDWGSDAPEGQVLPTDTTEYESVSAAEAAIDKNFTSETVIPGEKDGKEGVWTFSGWSLSTKGNVVYATGEWNFEEHQHKWGTVTYNWSPDNSTCTATRVCLDNSSHTESETAEVKSEVTTPASCTAKGKTTYTAVFENEWAEAQVKVLEDINALPHSYGTEWKSDDNSHWHECANCKDKTEVTDHTFVWVIDREATQTAVGYKHQECSVCAYERDAVEIPKLVKEEAAAPTGPAKTSDTPQTGDTGEMLFWIILGMMAAATGLAVKNRSGKSL